MRSTIVDTLVPLKKHIQCCKSSLFNNSFEIEKQCHFLKKSQKDGQKDTHQYTGNLLGTTIKHGRLGRNWKRKKKTNIIGL